MESICSPPQSEKRTGITSGRCDRNGLRDSPLDMVFTGVVLAGPTQSPTFDSQQRRPHTQEPAAPFFKGWKKLYLVQQLAPRFGLRYSPCVLGNNPPLVYSSALLLTVVTSSLVLSLSLPRNTHTHTHAHTRTDIIWSRYRTYSGNTAIRVFPSLSGSFFLFFLNFPTERTGVVLCVCQCCSEPPVTD